METGRRWHGNGRRNVAALVTACAAAWFPWCSVLGQARASAGGGAHGSGSAATAGAPTVRAMPLGGKIHIDGRLDEVAWRSADVVSEFTQREPDEGQPVSERTEVRVLVGAEALYVGARLFDRQAGQIRATLARRDVVADFDYLTVSLDSRHDRNTAFVFTLTPSGAYQDAALGADGELDYGWDPVWQGAATVDEDGWSAEWRIPFSQLRFERSEDAVWGIQLTRFIARKGETATFPFTPRTETSGPHRYARLTGLGRLHEPRRMEVLPYVSVRSERLNIAPDDPFRSHVEQSVNEGIDLKYGIGGGLTIDATLNPDFGQVELDPAVVNLTQFETYFPERRPFFVEGAEIFRYGFPGPELAEGSLGDLFYSRRIGGPPHGSAPVAGATFSDVPEQSTIAAATKLSGRVGGAWSVGLLDAVTTREEGRYATADGERGVSVVEPLTNYLVARVRRDLRQGNSTVGGIVTAVNRDLSGTPLVDLLHSSAYVGGIDFNHLWKSREWYLTGTLTGSRVQGSPQAMLLTQTSSARYFQRPDASHMRLDPRRTSLQGWRASMAGGRRSGNHWLGGVSIQAKSPGFEANDLGFESRVDSWSVSAPLQYRSVVPNRWTRSFQVDLVPYASWNFDGDLVDANVFVGTIQQWSSFWRSSTTVSVYPRLFADALTRGGPSMMTPAGGSVSQAVSTDERKSYTVLAEVTYAWNEYGAWGTIPRLSVAFHPLPALELTIGPQYQHIHALAQYVEAVPDATAERTYGTRYVFSDLDQTTLSVDTRVSWTFTPHLSLQLYAQPFLAAADYSRFKELHQSRKWGWDVYGEDIGALTEIPGGYRVDPDGSGPGPAFTIAEPDFDLRSLRGNAVLRWEYRPGSTLYVVWQQRRSGSAPLGDFRLAHDLDALAHLHPESILALKVSWWWGR